MAGRRPSDQSDASPSPEGLGNAPKLLAPVALAYGAQLKQFGIEARAVLWRSEENQRMRFDVLMGIVDAEDDKGGVSLADFGCGYGALFDFLKDMPVMNGSRYVGYDISEEMVATAQERCPDPRATFVHSLIPTEDADYSFVSGTFNLKLESDEDEWKEYIKESLKFLWARTKRGLAFNMLSIYGFERQEALYYADPCEYFDFCIRNLTPNVTLLHDYSPGDWTIWLRK